jgi:hypothetical protein
MGIESSMNGAVGTSIFLAARPFRREQAGQRAESEMSREWFRHADDRIAQRDRVEEHRRISAGEGDLEIVERGAGVGGVARIVADLVPRAADVGPEIPTIVLQRRGRAVRQRVIEIGPRVVDPPPHVDPLARGDGFGAVACRPEIGGVVMIAEANVVHCRVGEVEREIAVGGRVRWMGGAS